MVVGDGYTGNQYRWLLARRNAGLNAECVNPRYQRRQALEWFASSWARREINETHRPSGPLIGTSLALKKSRSEMQINSMQRPGIYRCECPWVSAFLDTLALFPTGTRGDLEGSPCRNAMSAVMTMISRLPSRCTDKNTHLIRSNVPFMLSHPPAIIAVVE